MSAPNGWLDFDDPRAAGRRPNAPLLREDSTPARGRRLLDVPRRSAPGARGACRPTLNPPTHTHPPTRPGTHEQPIHRILPSGFRSAGTLPLTDLRSGGAAEGPG